MLVCHELTGCVYRLRMEEKCIREHSNYHSEGVLQHIQQAIEPTRDAVLNALAKLESVQKSYTEFKQNHHLPHMKTMVDEYGKGLVEYQNKVSSAKQEFKESLGAWKHLLAYSNRVANAAAA